MHVTLSVDATIKIFHFLNQLFCVAEVSGFDLTKLINESEASKGSEASGRSVILLDVIGRDGNRVVIELIRGAL